MACGHLREAHLSDAIQSKQIESLIVLDQDLLSLRFFKEKFEGYQIETVHDSIRSFLNKKLTFDNLDLVYAYGLYDYLKQSTAVRMTQILFTMLRSGGRLLIPNSMPSIADIGYMKTFMQWSFLYRDSQELQALSENIAPVPIKNKPIFLIKKYRFIRVSKSVKKLR